MSVFTDDDDSYDPMDSGVERSADPRFVQRDRYEAALKRIAEIPKSIGYFNAPAAANEAVRIAKEALNACTSPFHFPVILHRSGGASAEDKNTCGNCGQPIKRVDGMWAVDVERL